jgi:hypothetical protein
MSEIEKPAGVSSAAVATALIILLLLLVYLVCVTTGLIAKDNRLNTPEVILIAAALVAAAICTSNRWVAAIEQVTVGSFTVKRKVGELKQELLETKEKLSNVQDALAEIFTKTSLMDQVHLIALVTHKGDNYRGNADLRASLVRLITLDLIQPLPGRSVDEIRDNQLFNLDQFFTPSAKARNMLRLLSSNTS